MTSVKIIRKNKYYCAVEMLFSSIAAFVVQVMGYSDNPKLTVVYGLYSGWDNYLKFQPGSVISTWFPTHKLTGDKQKLKEVAKT